jgi:hypothetical protein
MLHMIDIESAVSELIIHLAMSESRNGQGRSILNVKRGPLWFLLCVMKYIQICVIVEE